MKQYKINGLEKKEDELIPCLVCQEGKIFDKELGFRLTPGYPEYSEYLCHPCLTRYKKSRIDISNLKPLAQGWIKNILVEVENVITSEDLSHRELFKDFGNCLNHRLVSSQPFTTAMGELTVNSCPICKVAQVTIEGTTYENELSKLLNWVAEMSINKSNEKDILKDLGIDRIEIKNLIGLI